MKNTFRIIVLAVVTGILFGCGSNEGIRTGDEATGKPVAEVSGVVVTTAATPTSNDSPAPRPQEATPIPVIAENEFFIAIGETLTIPVYVNAESAFEAFSVMFGYDPNAIEITQITSVTGENFYNGLVTSNSTLMPRDPSDMTYGEADKQAAVNSTKGLATAIVDGASTIQYNGKVALFALTIKAKKSGTIIVQPQLYDLGLLHDDNAHGTKVSGKFEPIKLNLTTPMMQ